VRSSADSNAEGERGTWTLVLTDNGLVTYTKRKFKVTLVSERSLRAYIWLVKERKGG